MSKEGMEREGWEEGGREMGREGYEGRERGREG